MTQFTIDISDEDKLAGLNGAAAAAGMSADDYVQFVMDNACASYAKQFAPSVVAAKQSYDDAVAALDQKFAAAAASALSAREASQ